MAEFYPTVFLEDDPDDVTGRLRPYGVLGLGLFHFNPQGSYVDPATGATVWTDLRPFAHGRGGFPRLWQKQPDADEYSDGCRCEILLLGECETFPLRSCTARRSRIILMT